MALMFAVLALLIIYAALVIFFYSITVGRSRKRIHSQPSIPPAAARLKREDFTVESPQGYPLKGSWFFTDAEPQRIIVLVHGLGADRWDLLGMAEIYTAMDFSIITFDLRNHGESGGSGTTFGFYEHRDVGQIVNFAHRRFPQARIGVHGKSMGGAAALLYAARIGGAVDAAAADAAADRVDFFVIDAAFSNLKELFRIRLKEDYHLPNLGFIELAGLIARSAAGLRFDQVQPLKAAAAVHTPVLFIHGAEDRFVPTFMSKELFKAKPGEKMLHLAAGARHADTFNADPEGFTEAVQIFLREKVPALKIP